MVKLNSLPVLLVIANLTVFFASGFIGFAGDVAIIQKEILELEEKLPQLQEQHEWVQNAKACIVNPPEADAGKLLDRLNQMASRLGLEITEAAQSAGKVPEIKLAGSGTFNNISMILNSATAEKAVLPKNVRLEQTAENAWEFATGIAVRSGPWEYLPTQEKNPAPETVLNDVATINSGKPFAAQVAAQSQAPVIKEQIRYIGYFSEQQTPAVIIESSGKFAVLKCGETTPGGSIIATATAEELQLSRKDSSGKDSVWTVKMEKK